jgi:hypothetical protein
MGRALPLLLLAVVLAVLGGVALRPAATVVHVTTGGSAQAVRPVTGSGTVRLVTPDTEVSLTSTGAMTVYLPYLRAPRPGETYSAGMIYSLTFAPGMGAPITVTGFVSSAVPAMNITLVGGDQTINTAQLRRYARTANGWEQLP